MPRSVWLQFSFILNREGRSVQNWIEFTINQAITSDGTKGLTVKLKVAPVAKRRPAALKRLGALIDDGKLDRLQRLLHTLGLSREKWLLQKIGQFVADNPLSTTDLLSVRVGAAMTKWLPDNPDARREIVLALVDWDEAVILEAAADPEYGLRDAIRNRDLDRLSVILAVAAKGVAFKRERQALRR